MFQHLAMVAQNEAFDVLTLIWALFTAARRHHIHAMA
jgi:hypothetical protein